MLGVENKEVTAIVHKKREPFLQVVTIILLVMQLIWTAGELALRHSENLSTFDGYALPC